MCIRDSGNDIKETYTRNIEVGKVYDVRLTSSSKRTVAGASGIEFTGLHSANNPIEVTNNGKRLCLKDGDGTDCNASFTIDSGDVKFSADGKSLVGTGSVKFTLSWNDRPRTAGVAVQRIKIGTTTWTQSGRSGSETHTVQVGASSAGGNNNSNIQLRNKGKNVIQMEDWTDNDWADIICSATDGEFYDLQGRTCKFRVAPTSKTEIVYGKGLTSGSSKGGVTYDGPPLSTYVNGKLGPFITPTWNTDEEYKETHNGTTWIMTWENVDFPETGNYKIKFQNDAHADLYLDGKKIIASRFDNEVGVSDIDKANFKGSGVFRSVLINEGKHTLTVGPPNPDLIDTLFKQPAGYEWHKNPSGFALEILKDTKIVRKGADGKPITKSWKENPVMVSAHLIPPPCPRLVEGKGSIKDIIPIVPGCGYPIGVTTTSDSKYDVILELTEIIVEDPGINYDPEDDVINTGGDGDPVIPPFKPKTGLFGEIIDIEPVSYTHLTLPTSDLV